MTTQQWVRELAVAKSAAALGAAVVSRVYKTAFDVDFKRENDPVTAADREANAVIVAALREAFPDDAVCSEETRDEANLEEIARKGRCWFVDPLDGTKEFVARNGEFCVMIGLAVEGVAVLGVLVIPEENCTLWGAHAQGAFMTRDGVTVSVAARESSDPVRVVGSRSHRDASVEALALALGAGPMLACGSVGVKVARLLQDRADLYVHRARGPKLWDVCAPLAVATAAGLIATDEHGDAIGFAVNSLAIEHGIVIAPPGLHPQVIAHLRRAAG
ncbi:MAG: 3'(2'),5'-bisphosphate nucleotidase CysQ [Deltaproteobacteria bacterium]|nr:3'(2'),5'-bisphosphate nucleotidase CysQ [Deltaproteobacteria bacterium]